jgi:hypothetical protein
LGGEDTATEMLISFLYRYSTPSRSKNKARTYLSNNKTIRSEGGEAELKPVSVQHCIEFFQSCFQRIMDNLGQHGQNEKSLVASLIDMMKVKRERSFVLEQSKSFKNSPAKKEKESSADRKISHTFSKGNLISSFERQGGERRNCVGVDKETQEKVKALKKSGKRSNRGALIPKRRIDVEMKLDGMDALIQRGAKNRKNKRKQTRDAALTEFVMKSIS